MIVLFYIFSALLVYLSFRSFRGGIDYLNYFKNELAKPPGEYAPFATVIAPCKGLDEGLEDNLLALLEQHYPAYEVIYVVDDRDDSAVGVIDRLIARTNDLALDSGPGHLLTQAVLTCVTAKRVVAQKSVESSQKVENLREAVLHANNNSSVLVFVDSDARPAIDWLRHLVAPLNDKNIGAATGYRWFLSKSPSFAGEMRSAWNASIASALGPNTRSNFCWGGSMAIRRDTFDKLGIRERWRGTLSDDFTVTRAMNEANLPIYFVPQALTASIENCTFRELLEFTTRQMKITRVYAPHLWKLSFFGSGLFTIVMLAAFSIIVLSPRNNWNVAAAIGTLLLVSFFSIGKAWLRLMAVRLVLRQSDMNLHRQSPPQLTLWLLAPPLFLYNSLAALLSRRMRWRGKTYDMISPRKTRIVE